MNAINNTVRRPRAVFGRRGRGNQQSVHVKAKSNDYKDDDDDESASESSTSTQDSEEDDVERILSKSNSDKENMVTSAISKDTKGKSKASSNLKKPMQARQNESKSTPKAREIICISSDSEQEDDDSMDAIRSPQKRRIRKGKSSGPILIESSESDEEKSDQSDSLNELTKNLGTRLKVREDVVVDDDDQDIGHLKSLLSVCGQKKPQNFDECLSEIEKQVEETKWKKIGEATYSEVYSLIGSDTVLKVIPLFDIDDEAEKSFSSTQSEIPERSRPADLQREIEMTKGLSNVNECFVTLYRAAIVQGTYSERLLKAWDSRKRQKSDLNIRPDRFKSDQLFGLILLSDGGKDLESFTLQSWSQAASIYCQIVNALAESEKICQFEHRDLHWGNVVIKEIQQKDSLKTKNKRKPLEIQQISSPSWSGVHVTIIDFTLSRAHFKDARKTIAFELNDENFFTGKGDIQFDVYRKMLTITKGKWQDFFPITNVFWLHYLLRKVMQSKKLQNITDELEDKIGTQATCYELLSTVLRVLDDEEQDHTPTIKDAAGLYDLLVTTLPGSDKSF